MITKKTMYKLLIVSIFLIMLLTGNGFCVEDTSSTKMKVIGTGDAWTNINIGDSYTECENLNSLSSTLGTTALEAHLTTDYDWNAMAIFSVSQYGAATSNTPTTTTNNKSGIYETSKNTQTTTLMKGFSNTEDPFTKLYDSNGNLKKYINLIDPKTGVEYDVNLKITGREAISYDLDNGTKGWFGVKVWAVDRGTDYPLAIKRGLFESVFGNNYTASDPITRGIASLSATFRPVIWN